MGEDPLPLMGSCLKRIFRWRVPPNWSFSDWRNEMRAEAACAAWQAVCDYDPSLGVPFHAFARSQVLIGTLTRYRREWAYAFRSAQEYDPESSDSKSLDSAASAVFRDWLGPALARLPKPDLWLVEQLFLRSYGNRHRCADRHHPAGNKQTQTCDRNAIKAIHRSNLNPL
jgi:hypothetical protein